MDVKYILIVIYALEWTIAKNKKKIDSTSVVLSVFHNQNKSNNDTINYNEGDKINFICELQTKEYKYKEYTINMVHYKNGPLPTTLINTNMAFIQYMITAEEIDNKSVVLCNVTKKSKVINNNTAKELFMNYLGQQSGNKIENIEYDEGNPIRVSCNKGGTLIQKVNEKYVVWNKNISMTSSDSGSVIFCNYITYKTISNGIVYTRVIYNKRMYSLKNSQISSTKKAGANEMSVVSKSVREEIILTTNQPAATNEFSPQTSSSIVWKKWYIIGGSVSMASIILVGILLFLRKKSKEKPPLEVVPDLKYENIELNAASNQIIYAELELPEKSSNTHIFQKTNEPQYAQICNLQNNDNK